MDALENHWPEYLIEGACLGLFMISAFSFGTIFEHPASQNRDVYLAVAETVDADDLSHSSRPSVGMIRLCQRSRAIRLQPHSNRLRQPVSRLSLCHPAAQFNGSRILNHGAIRN